MNNLRKYSGCSIIKNQKELVKKSERFLADQEEDTVSENCLENHSLEGRIDIVKKERTGAVQ
ncbi:hypothetical protein C824_005678 [Schaedlerella arabinosiphila]|nr:hypothetical protein C824_005678 [Schaedlerella arabinosiphila]